MKSIELRGTKGSNFASIVDDARLAGAKTHPDMNDVLIPHPNGGWVKITILQMEDHILPQYTDGQVIKVD